MYSAEFGLSRSNSTSITKEIRLITVPLASSLSKVTHQGLRNRHGSVRDICLYLNVPYNNISYRFRDKRRFQSQDRKFSPPLVYLTPRRLKLGNGSWAHKN